MAATIAEDKVVLTLLTVIGSKQYSLLQGLVSPELPKDKSYDDLVDLLKKHFDPEPIVIAQQFHFEINNLVNQSPSIWQS